MCKNMRAVAAEEAPVRGIVLTHGRAARSGLEGPGTGLGLVVARGVEVRHTDRMLPWVSPPCAGENVWPGNLDLPLTLLCF